jgi:hypothetical protein
MVTNHKDLLVWQRSVDLVETVYRFTGKFPSAEQWGSISQMRRAAISVPSNIAEVMEGRRPANIVITCRLPVVLCSSWKPNSYWRSDLQFSQARPNLL